MSALDPQKSVDYYTYIGASGLSVTFQAPADYGKKNQGVTFVFSPSLPMQHSTLNIAETDIGLTDHTGRFQWFANQMRGQSNVQVGNEFWEIAPLTGSMSTGYSGSPTDMMNTPSTFDSVNNWALSYGFYDSGAGWGGLTNHDQSYAYLTPDVSSWMGA